MTTNEWNVPFVGRKDELAIVLEHLHAQGTRRVIFISGEGGVGKTRLLSEIEKRYAGIMIGQSPLKILDIIDFDDDRYKFPANIGFSIARQLDVEAFAPYFEASRELHLAEARYGDLGYAPTSHKALAVNRTFVESFNRVSQKSRVLLRFDTTDALSTEDTMVSEYLFKISSGLRNVLILIAGRNAERLYKLYSSNLERDAISISLPSLDLLDRRTYLKKKQEILKITLDKKWMEKLLILAGGLPVLIDLAIEWAESHRPLPWIEELTLPRLQELEKQAQADKPKAKKRLEELREQFKSEVVMPLAELQSSLDYLKLVLSKVYPLDLEGVMEMLNQSREEATDLIKRAKRSVAIKTLPDQRIKLHDEVQRLVNKYVWPKIDPDQEWEQRDSLRAIEYLTRKSSAILGEVRKLKQKEYELVDVSDPVAVMEIYGDRREKEIEFWSLRVERLRRQIYSDVYKGYNMYNQDYETAQTEVASIIYRRTLISIVEPFARFEGPKTDIHGNSLSKAHKLNIQGVMAREATYAGMYEQAARIYDKLLPRLSPTDENYLRVMDDQASWLVRAGKLQEALQVTEQIKRLSEEQEDDNWVAKSTSGIGWIHRLMGRLDMAHHHYTQALNLAMEQDDEKQIARVFSNLAYVHALQHESKALMEIQQAIAIWKEIMRTKEGERFQLGRCYNVAGEVCIELERPSEALQYFELSWNIFNLEETVGKEGKVFEWQSKSRSGRGFASWQLAIEALRKDDKQAAQRHLFAAQTDLEWAKEHSAPFDRPPIRNRLGEVYFLQGKYAETAQEWLQSMREAKQVGDAFTEFHSLSDLARLAFFQPLNEFPRWRDFETYYRRDYRRRYPGLYFKILHGLLHTYLGHLAFKNRQIEEAVRLYDSGLSILSQAGTYAVFNIEGQLTFIEENVFPEASTETVREMGTKLMEAWKKRSRDMAPMAYFRRWAHWNDKRAS
jgi:tetratricopeptide (TPR) repeat protein